MVPIKLTLTKCFVRDGGKVFFWFINLQFINSLMLFDSLQSPDRVGIQNERYADGQDRAWLPASHRPVQPRSVHPPFILQ